MLKIKQTSGTVSFYLSGDFRFSHRFICGFIWFFESRWSFPLNNFLRCTAKNTVISPDFLVWKFCGKAQFPHSFGWIARNYTEAVPFRKISTPRNQLKLRYFSQWWWLRDLVLTGWNFNLSSRDRFHPTITWVNWFSSRQGGTAFHLVFVYKNL